MREEYLLFTERLRNARETPIEGVVLLGQPGIGAGFHLFQPLVLVTHVVCRLGKSIYLLFFLVNCMARKEPVLFTTALGNIVLFNERGVARMSIENFLPHDHLPDFFDNASRTWSLVDCPEKRDPISSRVSIISSQLFFVAALSPDESRYRHLRKRPRVRIWWMSFWSNEEILELCVQCFRSVTGVGYADISQSTCSIQGHRICALPGPWPRLPGDRRWCDGVPGLGGGTLPR